MNTTFEISDTFERNSKTEAMASAVKDATNQWTSNWLLLWLRLVTLLVWFLNNVQMLISGIDIRWIDRTLDVELGCYPNVDTKHSSTDDMFEIAERKAVEAGLVSPDDIVGRCSKNNLAKRFFVQTQCVFVQYVNLFHSIWKPIDPFYRFIFCS